MKLTAMVLLLAVGCIGSAHGSDEPFEDCVADILESALDAARAGDGRQLRTMQPHSACVDTSPAWQIDYLRGYVAYRRAEVLMSSRPDAADEAFARASEYLSDARTTNPDCAVCHALLSTAQGKRIALSPMRGMILGGRVDENMESAIAVDGGHPVVLTLRAKRRLYAPASFGGDRERANELFEWAVEAFATAGPTPGWDAAEVHFDMAVGAEREGRYEMARRHLQAALEIDESFHGARVKLDQLGRESSG